MESPLVAPRPSGKLKSAQEDDGESDRLRRCATEGDCGGGSRRGRSEMDPDNWQHQPTEHGAQKWQPAAAR